MVREIERLQDLFFSPLEMVLSCMEQDAECEEYLGYHFKLDQFSIKFRKAKITPKKIGQFVTLWERNSDGITAPFHESSTLDFALILTERNEDFGFFLFPKAILVEKQILSTPLKEGKRGFRVYPDWDLPENKQAKSTKSWQMEYFVSNDKTGMRKLERILRVY